MFDQYKYCVIIPAYNCEKYIDKCISSIINQTYDSFEVVIVDDGSTDNTVAICDSYVSKYNNVRCFHRTNHGTTESRFFGIKQADSEYCLFCDADDFYEENIFEQIDAKLSNSNVDMLMYEFRKIDSNGKFLRHGSSLTHLVNNSSKKCIIEELVSNYSLNSLWTKVVRREILLNIENKIDKFRNVVLGEDIIQSIFIIESCKSFIILDKELYNYRVYSESVSKNYKIKFIYDFYQVYNEMYDFCVRSNMSNETIGKFYNRYIKNLYRYFIIYLIDGIEKKQFIELYKYSVNQKLYKSVSNDFLTLKSKLLVLIINPNLYYTDKIVAKLFFSKLKY